jgi:hypothetical protein
MSGKSSSGGQYGAAAAAVAATFVGDYDPVCLLFKQFSAVGATAGVSFPSGVGQVALSYATTGGPTAVNVVAQGSNDGGNSWSNLPTANVPAGSPRYTLVRLNCLTLSGGASPTVTVAALASP